MRPLTELAHLLNTLQDDAAAIARLLLDRSSNLPLANVRALKHKHAALTRRIMRLKARSR